jgi:NAD(P)-dependent dehydrogenase (short-subunit alcohol dehydrogenase family)
MQILVTGSNSGFGRLTSLALARKGHTVFATMREPAAKNQAAAADLRGIADQEKLALRVLELDVTETASVDNAIAAAGPLDVVVNNAGYAINGLAETATPDQYLRELDTNVVGPHRVNRAVLPGMRERRAGLIIQVSSGLGRILLPFVGIYASTKWAVEALAETYRAELKPTGVEMTIVQPGAFPTSFTQASIEGADKARAAGYGPLADGMSRMNAFLEQLFAIPDGPNPQEVADAIVALVETPAGKRPPRVVVDRFNGDGARSLNDAHAAVQKGLLAGMGMPFLAD